MHYKSALYENKQTMATSEGIPSSIDIEFLELNDNPYFIFVILVDSCLVRA